MSTQNEDTKSTADDAENSVESTESEQGILISEADLNELSKLLETFRDAILAHEARIGLVEAVVAQTLQAGASTTAPDRTPARPTLSVVGKVETPEAAVSVEPEESTESTEGEKGSPEA